MGKKNFIQIFLLVLLILTTFLIFNVYYKSDQTFKSSKTIKIENSESKSDEGKDIIKDSRYTSNNSNGDTLEILADYGEPSTEIDDLMFLTKVIANITLKNKSDIKLISDYANFNTKLLKQHS